MYELRVGLRLYEQQRVYSMLIHNIQTKVVASIYFGEVGGDVENLI